LAQLFAARYFLHKQVYSHPVVQAIEFMIGDIISESTLNAEIKEILSQDPLPASLRQYIGLTDSILREIERRPDPPTQIVRLRKRNLYQMYKEYVLKEKLTDEDHEKFFKELKSACGRDAHVTILKRNWCKGNKSPLDSIQFSPGAENAQSIDSLLPASYQEVAIRVFVKHKSDIGSIAKSIERCLSKPNLKKLIGSTRAGKKYHTRNESQESLPLSYE